MAGDALVTEPIRPRPRGERPERTRWQSSAKWTLVAVIGVTFGMFGIFYLLFLRG